MVLVKIEDDNHWLIVLWENQRDIPLSGCGGNQRGGGKVLVEPAGYRWSQFLPNVALTAQGCAVSRILERRDFAVDDR